MDDVFRIGIYSMTVQLVGVGAGLYCAYKVWGRRTMLLVGTGAAAISMVGPALGATIAPDTPEAAKTFLAFNFFYIIMYSGFAGSMTWPVSAEVVSSRLRVVTLSFATAVDYFFACKCSHPLVMGIVQHKLANCVVPLITSPCETRLG